MSRAFDDVAEKALIEFWSACKVGKRLPDQVLAELGAHKPRRVGRVEFRMRSNWIVDIYPVGAPERAAEITGGAFVNDRGLRRIGRELRLSLAEWEELIEAGRQLRAFLERAAQAYEELSSAAKRAIELLPVARGYGLSLYTVGDIAAMTPTQAERAANHLEAAIAEAAIQRAGSVLIQSIPEGVEYDDNELLSWYHRES